MYKTCHCRPIPLRISYDPRLCRDNESYHACMQRRCDVTCSSVKTSKQPTLHVPVVQHSPPAHYAEYYYYPHYAWLDDPFSPNFQYNYRSDASAHGGNIGYLNNFAHNAIGSPVTGFGF